ncbi:MAG TPA: LamG domain-containing protein [Planctomycetaceae bacterium]|nr:LamG domain-containing protein [Planctomycetaceae bacterium]
MTRQNSTRSCCRLLLAGAILFVCHLGVAPWHTLGQEDARHRFSYATWRAFRAELLRNPDVLRYYTFETTSTRRGLVQSVAGEREPLRYSGPEPFQRISGRWPQKKAVRLDRGAFQGKPFAVGRSGFAVEMWFRKRGQGALRGNGRTCGMLFALGNGYWEGARVWTAYPQKHLRFELGRPRPNNAIGTTSFLRVPDGTWHHLAATWDGRQLRLYVDGLVCGAVEYAGAFTPPTAPLRIGYADAGIGSLKLDVDEFVVWRRGLSPGEILQHALLGETIPAKIQTVLTAAGDAAARSDWAAAEAHYRKVLRAASLPATVRALGRLGLAQSLERQNRTSAAAAEYVHVSDNAAVPEHLRHLAMRLTLLPQRGIAWAIGSRKLYERLVQLPDLSPSEERTARWCLAEHCLDDGDAAAAREQYAALLQRDDLPDSTRWDIRLQTAHSYRVEKDYGRARAEYARLAQRPGVPAAVRSLALLSSADTFAREQNFAAACPGFDETRPDA